jgi:hypothetical protein
MTGWLVRDEKRFVGLTQLLPGLPLLAYGLAAADATLLLVAAAFTLFGAGRIGLTIWSLARPPAPVPAGVVVASRGHLLRRALVPLIALFLAVTAWGMAVSEDPRALLAFLGVFMVFDGVINLGQAAVVADWERRHPARLIRANHLLYLAQ